MRNISEPHFQVDAPIEASCWKADDGSVYVTLTEHGKKYEGQVVFNFENANYGVAFYEAISDLNARFSAARAAIAKAERAPASPEQTA